MRTELRFLLGDEERRISSVEPTRTVLQYLREDEHLCGTKEGCAEGDCGACTVMTAERMPDGSLRYRPVNACIMFLPALDGKQLLTVEHLASRAGGLHPVQQAMLDHHASQCGFCTPGFVMSLATLHREGATPDRQSLSDALAGNLCRCTGYRPILDAATAVLSSARPSDEETLASTLAKLDTESETLDLTGEHGHFIAPRSLAELTALLAAEPEGLLLGGGTDIGLWVTKQQRRLPLLIATEQVAEMRVIEHYEDRLIIGGAVTYADAAAALTHFQPAAAPLLRRIASRQIRERGTIGGNIGNASPIGDMPPLLIALGAVLVLVSAYDTRRLPIEEFFLAYRKTALESGEVIAAIEIPRARADTRIAAYKVSKRFDQDISAVCAGFALRLEGERIREVCLAYGGMAATPARATGAEMALIGQPWTDASVHAAMAALTGDFTPLSDMRASAAYRAHVAQNLLLKFYLEHPGEGAPLTLRLDVAAEGAEA